MEFALKKHYKLHIFVFTLLSIHLFILVPITFISKFLAVAVCLCVFLHIKKIKFEFTRWYEMAIFVIVNAYLTLAFFGYDLFLAQKPELLINLSYLNYDHPELQSFLDMGGPYLGLLYFGLGFIWTGYVLQSFLDLIKSLDEIKDNVCVPSKNGYWKKWLILLAIMFSIFMTWQRAFNPIVMTPDSWGYIDGWLTGTYNSFRSPVYSFLIYIVCSLAPTKPEVQWIAITQIFAFSSLLATVLMYFHKKWIRFKYIIPVAIILPLIPSFGLHTIVVWCDLANGMTMLWLTYALVRILDEVIIHNTASKKQQLSLCVQLCISMIFAYFIRSNSFLVYLVMAPVLALLFVSKKQWKLIISVGLSVVVVLLIRIPGYSAIGVAKNQFSEHAKYFAGIHDIHAAYYAGGNLTERTESALRRYIPKIDELEIKNSFRRDYVFYSAQYDLQAFAELTTREFIPMYIDSFIRNPFLMAKSMLFRVRAYWVIDPKETINCVNPNGIYSPSLGSHTQGAPEIGVYRQSNFLTNVLHKYVLGMTLSIPATFVWRFGIWTALMVVSIMTLILQKRFIWLFAYLPVFIYIATLYLTSGWPDYRYGLPVFFIGLFLPLALILLRPTINDKEILR